MEWLCVPTSISQEKRQKLKKRKIVVKIRRFLRNKVGSHFKSVFVAFGILSFPPLTTFMIRTVQKILFVKMICQASFDISVFRYPYQSIVDKN